MANLPVLSHVSKYEAKDGTTFETRKEETTPPPDGQKYAPGTRVRIAVDLGPSMSHFASGANATVKYTYAHAYGGSDVKSYCLDIDGRGQVSWYYEHQLTPIDSLANDSSAGTGTLVAPECAVGRI